MSDKDRLKVSLFLHRKYFLQFTGHPLTQEPYRGTRFLLSDHRPGLLGIVTTTAPFATTWGPPSSFLAAVAASWRRIVNLSGIFARGEQENQRILHRTVYPTDEGE